MNQFRSVLFSEFKYSIVFKNSCSELIVLIEFSDVSSIFGMWVEQSVS